MVANLDSYTAIKLNELTKRANKTIDDVASRASVAERDITARRDKHEKFVDSKINKIRPCSNTERLW